MASPGSPVTAAEVNLAQQRNVGPSGVFTSDGTSGTYASETQVDTATFSVVSGRKYRIGYVFNYSVSGITPWVSAGWTVRIKEGSSSGTQLTYLTADGGHVNAGVVLNRSTWVEWTATSTGSQTFTTTALRATGSGSMQPKGATGQPRVLSCEWLGVNA